MTTDKKIPVQNNQHGKVPPQSIDLEKAVLGTLIASPNSINEISDIIISDSFYTNSHQLIFKAIEDLYRNGNPIDLLTVVHKLKESGVLEVVGGAYYVSELTNFVNLDQHIRYQAAIIVQQYIKRKLIEISSKMIQDGFDESTDCFDLISQYQIYLSELELGYNATSIFSANQFVPDALQEIHETIQLNKDGLKKGIPTFSKEIDEKTGGFIRGGLSIISGRPGEGKTAALLQSVLIDLNAGFKVGIISLEMSKTKLTERIFSNICRINGFKIRDGNLTEKEFESISKEASELMKKSLFISDNPYTDELKLRPLIRQFVKKHKCEIVYLDYFQLVKVMEKENKVYANESLSQTLQKIAREFDIAIVALSQQARTGNNRPSMESLRGGGIEQASDLIINLWDSTYQTEDNLITSDMLAIVSKAKHGSTLDAKIHYNKQYQTIEDGHYGANGNPNSHKWYESKETIEDIF